MSVLLYLTRYESCVCIQTTIGLLITEIFICHQIWRLELASLRLLTHRIWENVRTDRELFMKVEWHDLDYSFNRELHPTDSFYRLWTLRYLNTNWENSRLIVDNADWKIGEMLGIRPLMTYLNLLVQSRSLNCMRTNIFTKIIVIQLDYSQNVPKNFSYRLNWNITSVPNIRVMDPVELEEFINSFDSEWTVFGSWTIMLRNVEISRMK